MTKKPLKGYLCGNDLTDIHMGASDVVIFPTMKKLKVARSCWRECGIIEITIQPKFKVKPKNSKREGLR